jgi:DNA repair ATPase RecN
MNTLILDNTIDKIKDKQNIDDLTSQWLEKENKYKKDINNINKIILEHKQDIDNMNKQWLEKENEYIQQIQNLTIKYQKQIEELINKKNKNEYKINSYKIIND